MKAAARLARLLVTLPLLVPAGSSAQTVHGWVIDESTNRPVSGATVSVLDAVRDTVLALHFSAESRFDIYMRHPDVYRLRVQSPGYAPLTTHVIALGESAVVALEVRLRADTPALDPVRVVATRIEPAWVRDVREREIAGWGRRFLMREDLHGRAGSVADVLASMPGVHIARIDRAGSAQNPSRQTTPVVEMRADARPVPERRAGDEVPLGRMCYASLYLDGRPVFTIEKYLEPSTRNEALAQVDAWMSKNVSEIEAVEIYRDAAELPALYGDSTSECGVVAAWTRSDFSAPSGSHGT